MKLFTLLSSFIFFIIACGDEFHPSEPPFPPGYRLVHPYGITNQSYNDPKYIQTISGYFCDTINKIPFCINGEDEELFTCSKNISTKLLILANHLKQGKVYTIATEKEPRFIAVMEDYNTCMEEVQIPLQLCLAYFHNSINDTFQCKPDNLKPKDLIEDSVTA